MEIFKYYLKGLGTQASINPVSDYWKSFGLCKICLKCGDLQLGTKNKFGDFFANVF